MNSKNCLRALACAGAVLGGFSASADIPASATLHWRGTTDALASKAANWVDGEGNPAAAAPLNGDAVVFDAQSAAKPMTWDIDDVELASWTQDVGYTGTVVEDDGTIRWESGLLLFVR